MKQPLQISSSGLIQLLKVLDKNGQEMVRSWLERGDGVAVYINSELGHPEAGHMQFLSYGSPQAQIEADEPPLQMPDIAGAPPNWRYRLYGTHRTKVPA